MVIDTVGLDLAVIAMWRSVWMAVEATVALCVRNGEGGITKVHSKSSSKRMSFTTD